MILNTQTLRVGEAALASADKVMARIINANPPIVLRRRQAPFHSLVVSVINQQLSQKAAGTIAARLLALCGDGGFLPSSVAALTDSQLRGVGLSRSKVGFLRALVVAADNGDLELARLQRLSDAEVVASLSAIHGIGRWTAEMFMMFALRRADVVSLGDAALCRSARIHYGRRGDSRGDARVLLDASEKWSPWRTVGCLHLWRSLR